MWYGDFGLLDSDVPFFMFCAASGVLVVLAVINIFIGCCVRGSAPGTSMDFYISTGSLLLSFTVLVRGVSTEWASQSDLDILCQLFPASLLVGLTMVIGGLLVKSWAVWAYFRWHDGHKMPISQEWKPNLWMWLLLIIVGIASVIWSVLFENSTKPDTARTTGGRSVYTCKWEKEFEWQVATSVWHLFLLLVALASVLANCCGGKTSCRMASPTAVVIINTVGAVIAGVCVHFAVDASPTVYYGITGALVLWICLFANIVFLVTRLTKTSKKQQPFVDESYDTIKTESSLGAANMGNDNALMLQERNKNSGRPGEVFNY